MLEREDNQTVRRERGEEEGVGIFRSTKAM